MRLIDADELFKKLSTLSVDDSNPMGQGYFAGISDVSCLIVNAPTIDPVKHGHYNYIKYLYLVDGYYVVNETMKCSECNNQFLNDGCNYCDKCGAKLDKEPLFFRKKTIFVEGEDAIVPISKLEYQKASRWEYEID